MPSIQLDSLSSFGRAALKLDTDFSELERLSGQLQRVEIDSDSGLDRAVKILEQFAVHGQAIATGIQDFSTLLQEARLRSEAAAKLVSERAELIGQRKGQQNQIREKLNRVEQDVKVVNENLRGMKREGKSEFSEAERNQIRAELERLNGDLKKFLSDVQEIKDAATQSKFKSIERDAQSLLDALRTSSRRLDKAITGQ